ncbi:hypothetical protein ACFX2K_023267 [Malus domestica]
MYWQGYNGASLNMSDHPLNHIPLQSSFATSHPFTIQNKAPKNQSFIAFGVENGSECLPLRFRFLHQLLYIQTFLPL